jgi:hypothetical protein
MTVREVINCLLDRPMDSVVSLVEWDGLVMREHEVADVWSVNGRCFISIGRRIDNINDENRG